MGRGGGAGPARGDGGSWLRTYDRVVAMVGKVEALVAGRAQLEAVNELQHEFWEDRGGVLQARFLQVAPLLLLLLLGFRSSSAPN